MMASFKALMVSAVPSGSPAKNRFVVIGEVSMLEKKCSEAMMLIPMAATETTSAIF